jgi:hypothetical protein
MTKKAAMKKNVRRLTRRKASGRERKRRAHALSEPRTYVTEKHWELC